MIAIVAGAVVPLKVKIGKPGTTKPKVGKVAGGKVGTTGEVGNTSKGGDNLQISGAKKLESAGVSGKTTVLAEYGPLNKGPLPDKIAETFRSGTYKEIITTDTTTLYRVYGGSAKELGPYWTTTKPSGPVQSIIDSALDQKWGNTATQVVKIKVPAGVKFYEGFAEKQSALVGGGNQVFFLDKVDPSWVTK